MGHRKRASPRRGSLAYLPRGRAKKMEARIRDWPKLNSEEPKLLGHVGFKAGCVQIVSIDDREKTPNSGKQLVSLGTVIVTPPIIVLGFRGYTKNTMGHHVNFDVYAEDIPKNISKYVNLKPNEGNISQIEKNLGKIKKISVLIAVSPKTIGLDQKKPSVFEASISGGDINKQFAFAKNLLGKVVKFNEVFQIGEVVDVAAITKGKGWEGPITRWGVKKKQHKSRKSVREVGSLGPISPQNVMYTVPRAGQRGFHQRIEYDKRIMIISDTEKNEYVINPKGGFKHFGLVKGEYIVLKGSVPGTYRRMIKLRAQMRNIPSKIFKPNILEVVV